jgi:uncharacterized membrane protein YfcA
MHGWILGLFLFTTFFGGIVTGLAGFAMGLVVSGVWLHILTPAQTASLIVGYGLLTQSYNIWKLRHALNWRTVAPFVTGGLIGVPIGAALVTYVDPNYVRTGVGVLLIVYSLYSLARPHLKPRNPGFAVDAGVGIINGVLGGMTGLAGPVITMWCNFRGFRKDVQRAIYQPVILAAFVLTAISLAVAGVVTADLIRIYLYGLPTLAVGLWIGLKLYGHLNEETFRKVILVLLLFSGLALVVPFR